MDTSTDSTNPIERRNRVDVVPASLGSVPSNLLAAMRRVGRASTFPDVTSRDAGFEATHRALGEWLHAHVRAVDDFPKPGVVFQDLSPVYREPGLVCRLAESVISVYRGRFDHVVAIDARGFVLGAVVAHVARRPLVLLRKPGKLPGPVLSQSYELEYGTAELEIQRDALPGGAKAVVVDDVLATGGTLAAAAALVEASNAIVTGFAVVLEISALGGRALLYPHPVFAAGRVGERQPEPRMTSSWTIRGRRND